MKIRTGFVSNSSSSSFAAIGTCIWDHDEIERVFPSVIIGDRDPWKVSEEIESLLHEKFRDTPITYLMGEDLYIYIGLEWHNMLTHETLGEFVKRAETLIKEALPEVEGVEMIVTEVYS